MYIRVNYNVMCILKEAAHETAEIKNEMLDRRAQERKHAILVRQSVTLFDSLPEFSESEFFLLFSDPLCCLKNNRRTPLS